MREKKYLQFEKANAFNNKIATVTSNLFMIDCVCYTEDDFDFISFLYDHCFWQFGLILITLQFCF